MNIEKLNATQDSLKSIYQRLSAPTPVFWKKVRRVMITVGGISAAVLTGFATAGIAIPAIITTVCTYGVVVGATGTALANLPVDWDKVGESGGNRP